MTKYTTPEGVIKVIRVLGKHLADQERDGCWPAVMPSLREVADMLDLSGQSTGTAHKIFVKLEKMGYARCQKQPHGRCAWVLTREAERIYKENDYVVLGGIDTGRATVHSSLTLEIIRAPDTKVD